MKSHLRHQTESIDGALLGHTVTCEEFQSKMPQLLGQGIRDHEHLKTCARCSALLEELEYIAGMAKDLLLPVHEPSDSLWDKINRELSKPDDSRKTANHLSELSAEP